MIIGDCACHLRALQNSPAWNEAVETLVKMGAEVVTPYFLQTLLDRNSQQYWIDAIHGICMLLTLKRVERAYAVPCGPAIAYLLSQDDLADAYEHLDPEYLLDVLEKIGPECATYALPALLYLVSKEGSGRLGQQARNMIASFEETTLELYKLLLPLL